jgi:hypothetical protein
MLQVLHDRAREVDVDEGGPLGRSVPLMRAGSEAGAVVPTCMHRRMCTAAAGGAGLAVAARGRALFDDNSNSVPVGGQELHACAVGPRRQSGRRRHGADVPSGGRIHPGKCVACAVFLPHAEGAHQVRGPGRLDGCRVQTSGR